MAEENELLPPVTLENLKERHGVGAEAIFNEIKARGGFGDIPVGYIGGLDINGVTDKDGNPDPALRDELRGIAENGLPSADTQTKSGGLVTGKSGDTQGIKAGTIGGAKIDSRQADSASGVGKSPVGKPGNQG